MGDPHSHNHASRNERGLWIALSMNFSLLVLELAGAYFTKSLALLSDAAHMLTDVTALFIALGAIRLSRRPPDNRRTFGYYRFEILAAGCNAVLLFLAAGYIVYEAIQRFRQPAEVASGAMLAVAVAGLAANLISMKVLAKDAEDSLNLKGAYLEVWSDALGSLGVIVAALVIHWTGWQPADPLVALLIGLWVLPRSWTILSETLNVLLEGVPAGLTLDAIRAALQAIPGVLNVHDLHVWSITTGKNTLTAHITIDPAAPDSQAILARAHAVVEGFGITHSTVQIETIPFEHEHEY